MKRQSRKKRKAGINFSGLRSGSKANPQFIVLWKNPENGQQTVNTMISFSNSSSTHQPNLRWHMILQHRLWNKIVHIIHSFINSWCFYSTSSSPLLLRSTPDYSIDTLSELTCRNATWNCKWRTCPRSLHGGKNGMRPSRFRQSSPHNYNNNRVTFKSVIAEQ